MPLKIKQNNLQNLKGRKLHRTIHKYKILCQMFNQKFLLIRYIICSVHFYRILNLTCKHWLCSKWRKCFLLVWWVQKNILGLCKFSEIRIAFYTGKVRQCFQICLHMYAESPWCSQITESHVSLGCQPRLQSLWGTDFMLWRKLRILINDDPISPVFAA